MTPNLPNPAEMQRQHKLAIIGRRASHGPDRSSFDRVNDRVAEWRKDWEMWHGFVLAFRKKHGIKSTAP